MNWSAGLRSSTWAAAIVCDSTAAEFTVAGVLQGKSDLTSTIDGVRTQATVVESHGAYYVFQSGRTSVLKWVDPLATDAVEGAQEGSLRAPIPGRVTTLLVEPGKQVEKGTPLLVLEAMKMEYTIEAPAAGKVEAFLFGVGDQVAEGTQLVQFEREGKAGH